MKTNRLDKFWHALPSGRIRELQVRKLRSYLQEIVLPFHGHYRRVFREQGIDVRDLRTLEDLRYLPFTSKADLTGGVETAKQFVIAPDPGELARRPSTMIQALLFGKEGVRKRLAAEFRPIFMTSTTGRSAEPIPFLYTQHDLAVLRMAGRRLMELAGARQEDRMLSMFPFAPHLAFWQAHYAGTEFGVLLMSSGGGKTMGTDGNIRLLKKLQPDVLIGMPTFVYHVLHEAALDAVRCERLRAIVLGGEKVPPGLRRKLRELAVEVGARDVSVLSTYAFTEAKMAWCECLFPAGAESPGYHLYPDVGIVEVVDPVTGAPRADGESGEIVFTALEARGTCVLRYRTGDLIDGGLRWEPCPCCGRTMPRLVGHISRRSELREMQLEKLKGTLVDFNVLEHVLDDMPEVGTWQIELRKAHDDPLDVDELIVHVAAIDGADARLSEKIASRLFDRAELRPNVIEFHNASELRTLQGVGEKLKEQRLVDRRADAGARHSRAIQNL